ncbi:MAG: hypothetical protein B7Z55_11910 [Planctomycetales bacterium 12-60-4]|nr:MAG: hypothetical protein B7Z55_11910 [Planctomycetales bacterium 12-60-4]
MEEEALVWLSGEEGGAAGPPLEQAFAGADIQLREGLGGAVAALAVAGEDRLNLLKEEFVAGLGGQRKGETKEDNETIHGGTPSESPITVPA